VVRMTKASRMAIEAAEKIVLQKFAEGWGIYVFRGGQRLLVQCAESGIVYPTRALARRAVKRIRPDLDPVDPVDA